MFRATTINVVANRHNALIQLKQIPGDGDLRHRMRNLAANPKHAPVLAQLEARLRELMREMKDPLSPEALDAPGKTGKAPNP